MPSGAKFKTSRKAARKLMLDVAGHLVGQKFDDDTFIVTTSGRCEYRNKGIDVYLDSLATLVSMNPERNVLAFVMVPAWCKEPREDLQEALHSSEYARLEEPVITHWLHNMDQDPVLGRIRSIGFGANVNSKVTVIYVPCYLNGTDGVFNMPYYDLLIGMDVTVFPSYYEPWGYTPLESVAFGVPTITTSLSGFGQWVKLTSKASFDVSGVSVVERGDGNYHHVVHSIASDLKHLVEADDSTVKSVALSAMATSDRAAWEYFIEYYQQAYNMALQNALKRNE